MSRQAGESPSAVVVPPRPPCTRAPLRQSSSALGTQLAALSCRLLMCRHLQNAPTTFRRQGKCSRRVVVIVEGCGSDFASWIPSTTLVDFRGGRDKRWTGTRGISGIALAKSPSSGGDLVLSPKGLRSEAAAALLASRTRTLWFRWFRCTKPLGREGSKCKSLQSAGSPGGHHRLRKACSTPGTASPNAGRARCPSCRDP